MRSGEDPTLLPVGGNVIEVRGSMFEKHKFNSGFSDIIILMIY